MNRVRNGLGGTTTRVGEHDVSLQEYMPYEITDDHLRK
jgi:hypothetical protein